MIDEMSDHITKVNEVAAEYLKGKNVAQIGQELNITPATASRYLSEWKGMAANSDAVRARAREALSGADLHYNTLIADAYALVQEAKDANYEENMTANQSLSLRAGVIKTIADLEAKRIDMLQRAGLLENQELAEQLIEQERKQELITKIIVEVVSKCPTCKPRVLQRMSGLDTVIVESEVD